jgi:hypothetical protein
MFLASREPWKDSVSRKRDFPHKQKLLDLGLVIAFDVTGE